MAETFDLTNPLKPTIIKDPNAVLDYTIDLTEWCDAAGDTLSEAAPTTLTNGMLVERLDVLPRQIVVWARGGESGKLGSITIHFKGSGTPTKREDDRTLYFRLKER